MARAAWPLLMVLCLACLTPSRIPTVTPAPTVVPSAPAPATAAPAHFGRIEDELAALRGLPFLRSVPFAQESRKDFRARVHKELGRELTPQKNEVLSRAFADLGLAPAGFNLLATLEDALTTQVAAYYDPESKSFRVLKDARDKDVDEIVVAHELAHALADQHFDLETFDGGPGNRLGLSEETRTARQFVTEGEATFMMMAWKAAGGQGKNKHLGPLSVAGLRMGLAMVGAADMIELMASTRQGRSLAELAPEDREELDQLSKLPPMISLSLVEPYFKGAAFISEAWGRGGWEAVNDLYRHPPDSTEQILHFKEKFFDRRDPPVEFACPRNEACCPTSPRTPMCWASWACGRISRPGITLVARTRPRGGAAIGSGCGSARLGIWFCGPPVGTASWTRASSLRPTWTPWALDTPRLRSRPLVRMAGACDCRAVTGCLCRDRAATWTSFKVCVRGRSRRCAPCCTRWDARWRRRLRARLEAPEPSGPVARQGKRA